MPISAITDTNTIYRHETRPEWGDAILAWDREGKRGYMFEDGQLRIFKDGWYHMLSEVDQPLNKAAATAARLERKLGLASMRKKIDFDGPTFDDQILLFTHYFPDGFDGDAWPADKRGEDAARRLKRHRDAAIADARNILAAKKLDELIAAEHFEQAWTDILGVLARTDLVTKRHLDPLRTLNATFQRDLTIRVRDMLWGEESYDVRFERFVASLALATGKEPDWQLATALTALVHPKDHVAVRPSVARIQAAWMAPTLLWNETPNAPLYERLRRMALAVRDELTDAGHVPRDLLDVYDFMWTTLRTKARKELGAIKDGADDLKQAV